MKKSNIGRENFHICWKTWRISMKFSEKISLMIILKVTENRNFILSLEDIFLEKLQGRQIDPPAFLG